MPAATEVKIWKALEKRISTLVTNPVMTRVNPGQVFTPPNNAPFLLISDARNDVQRIGIDKRLHVHSGTLLLSARWPIQTGISHESMMQIGGSIAAHFTADTSMSFGGYCIRVTEDSTVLQPEVDGAYRFVTVRVLWSSIV